MERGRIRGKKKDLKRYKQRVLAYLTQQWENGHVPRLKQVVADLQIKDKSLLIEVLRQLRYARVLDGSYDLHGIYRLYPFKKYARLPSDLILATHYKNSQE